MLHNATQRTPNIHPEPVDEPPNRAVVVRLIRSQGTEWGFPSRYPWPAASQGLPAPRQCGSPQVQAGRWGS